MSFFDSFDEGYTRQDPIYSLYPKRKIEQAEFVKRLTPRSTVTFTPMKSKHIANEFRGSILLMVRARKLIDDSNPKVRRKALRLYLLAGFRIGSAVNTIIMQAVQDAKKTQSHS